MEIIMKRKKMNEKKLIQGMEQVFEECKIKAVQSLKKPGNTDEPWNDFPID